MPSRTAKLFLLLLVIWASSLLFASESSAPYVETLILEARQKELWKERQWLDLGHYRKRFWGGVKSEADGLDFFLSGKRGIEDPRVELDATLRGFFLKGTVAEGKQHPQCQFPARFLWLESQLHWDRRKLPRKSCPRYEEFRSRLAAKSATLVFSSYYLNNPSSAFGHTLLRLNKSEHPRQGERHELLDHGINYAAVATTKNPFLYAFMGMSGLFKGSFASVPYYYKVREYNDFESRDLWGYDLNLTPAEIRLLVAHFWELGSTYFDYFYLTENCSYHMLTALEAAAPRFDLVDPLPYYVIPADTVKVVSKAPGLVSRINYRPSVRSQFHYRTQGLNRTERRWLSRIVSKRDLKALPEPVEPERKAAILDTATDYLDFRYFEEIATKEPEAARFKHELLLARSRLGVPSPKLEIPTPLHEAPHLGHESSRVGVAGGVSDDRGAYAALSHRFALHDLLDPSIGYPDQSQIEFLNLELRKNLEDRWFWVEEASLFNVVSLTDFNRFHPAPSWKFRLGGTTFRDQACSNCFGFLTEGGVGLSKRFFTTIPASIALTLDGEASAAPKFRGPDFRFRYGPMALIRLGLRPNLQLMMTSRYRRPLISDYSSNVESVARLRWGILRNFALDLQARRYWRPNSWEGGLGLLLYY